MADRKLILGDYDTAANGFTLAGLALSSPEMKTNYIEKLGGDGSWDLSTALTDGLPRYKTRTLTATLELSGQTRSVRMGVLQNMIAMLDGYEHHIVHPDRPDHYLVGRVHTAVSFNDHVHARVALSAICDPWFYAKTETVRSFTATSTEQTATLTNNGRKALVPVMTVAGGSIQLTYGTDIITMSAGTYQWPSLLLTTGAHSIKYKGAGTLTIKYREAVLL